ncbi:hypothetical protein EKK58_03095 [Candidatus Dependentiae bacterium]|nr:MAG: hypothetical protein EKK58_03095 [Candidatus Dependentiae bacterium]
MYRSNSVNNILLIIMFFVTEKELFGQSGQGGDAVVKHDFVLPDRDTISIKGNIAKQLVDRTYALYNSNLLPTVNISFLYNEEDKTFESTFFDQPVSFFETLLLSETSYNNMFFGIDQLWQLPSDQEYQQAVDYVSVTSVEVIKQQVSQDKQQYVSDNAQRLIELLRKYEQYSDEDFVKALIACFEANIGLYTARDVYPTVALYNEQSFIEKEQVIKEEWPKMFKGFEHGPCLVTPEFVLFMIDIIKQMGGAKQTVWPLAFSSMKNIVPEIDFLFSEPKYTQAIEKLLNMLLLKILKGALKINLGNTFQAYFNKRTQEIDYIILQKIIAAGVNYELLKQAPVTMPLDENTTCYVKIGQNLITGDEAIQIKCVVSF